MSVTNDIHSINDMPLAVANLKHELDEIRGSITRILNGLNLLENTLGKRIFTLRLVTVIRNGAR
jgi:hypothetical protein